MFAPKSKESKGLQQSNAAVQSFQNNKGRKVFSLSSDQKSQRFIESFWLEEVSEIIESNDYLTLQSLMLNHVA